MPESKPSRTSSHRDDIDKIGNPAKRSEAERTRQERRRRARQADEFRPVAGWYKVLMFGLMIVGLLWVVTFYIANMLGAGLPIPGIGNWNILIGVGIAMVGFIMMMGWRD